MKNLKKMFSLEGRATRTEYCTSFIICVIVTILTYDFIEIKIIWNLIMIWFMIAQGSKRAHDLGQSGLIQIIPFYNLSLFFIKGDLKANKYGEVPKMNSVINETSIPLDNELKVEIEDLNITAREEKSEEISSKEITEEFEVAKPDNKHKTNKHIKILIAVIFFVLTIGFFLNFRHKAKKSATETSNPPICESTIIWGEIDICLPKIESYHNVVDSPSIIKNRLSLIDGMGNTTYAFLINQNTFNQFKNIDNIIFDDYFLLLTVDKLKNIEVKLKDLNNITKEFQKQFVKMDINQLNKFIEGKNSGSRISKPSVIEDYKTNETSSSIVCLTPIDQNGYKYYQITISNLFIVKNRLVGFYYYKNYFSHSSIDSAKNTNDKIALQFSNSNPPEQ